jgi:hypothetical protein
MPKAKKQRLALNLLDEMLNERVYYETVPASNTLATKKLDSIIFKFKNYQGECINLANIMLHLNQTVLYEDGTKMKLGETATPIAGFLLTQFMGIIVRINSHAVYNEQTYYSHLANLHFLLDYNYEEKKKWLMHSCWIKDTPGKFAYIKPSYAGNSGLNE